MESKNGTMAVRSPRVSASPEQEVDTPNLNAASVRSPTLSASPEQEIDNLSSAYVRSPRVSASPDHEIDNLSSAYVRSARTTRNSKRYLPAATTDSRGGSGARTTRNSKKTPLLGFYSAELNDLFEESRKSGVYKGGRFIGTFMELFKMELDMWTKCVQLCNEIQDVYFDGALWGRRDETLNVQSKYTYKQLNPYFITSSQLCANGDTMRRIISSTFNKNPNLKCCIFMCTSLGKDEISEPVLHTNVLVVNKNDGKHSCKCIYTKLSISHCNSHLI